MGRESFYGLLASMRCRLFRDADFAEFYCPDNGRDSVPPSLLATALLLQSHDKVSDAEAKTRADFDLRWKVAWGLRRKTGRGPAAALSRVPGSGVRGRGSGERETTASSLAGKQQAREKEDNGGQGKDGPAGAIAQGGNGR